MPRRAITARRVSRTDDLAAIAFTAARVGICIVDAAGRLVLVNPAYCALLGEKESDLLGTQSEIARVARAGDDEGIAARIGPSGAIDNELKLRRKDGSEFWALVSGQPLDPRRPARGTVWVVRDITPRKQLEESLGKALSEREAILQTSLVGISFVRRRRHVWVNRALAEMVGCAPEDLIGNPIGGFLVDPDGLHRLHEDTGRALSAGQSYTGEFRMRRRDGREIWVHLAGRALDPGDLAQGAIWVLNDITQRKQLEEDLERTLAERELILKSTLVGITYAAKRRVLWMNETFARMLGYEREELIGHPTVLHFPDTESYEAFRAEAHKVLASGRPYVGENRMRRKDGTLIWCQLHGNAIDPADLGKGSIWTNVDITERKRAEEEIRRALERERELNELKSRFISMTSHEFRTPLATILSSAELLERYDRRLEEDKKAGILNDVKAATKRMAAMLDQVLLIGRADAGQLGFEPSPLDLQELCRKIMDEVRVTTAAAHDLRFACSGDCENVAVDERLVRHIVGNLLSNAVKYSPDGGIVSLDLAREGDIAVIAVTDAGIGITAADQLRLYESFHRGQNARNIPGTGLGLAIVKKAVDQHGGRIAVESNPGQGARFTVTLPLTSGGR